MKDISYYEDAIVYNTMVGDAAREALETVKDPIIKKWCRAVAKQHDFHLDRHQRALDRMRAGEDPGEIEVMPEVVAIPEEVDQELSPEEVQRLDAQIEAESQRNTDVRLSETPDVDYRSSQSGQYVTEEYAKAHPDVTVGEVEKPTPVYLDDDGNIVTKEEREAQLKAREDAV
jgi:hypothetical protein